MPMRRPSAAMRSESVDRTVRSTTPDSDGRLRRILHKRATVKRAYVLVVDAF